MTRARLRTEQLIEIAGMGPYSELFLDELQKKVEPIEFANARALFDSRLYVVQAGPHVKVGYTSKPKLRISELKHGNPLVAGYYFLSEPSFWATDMEREVHRELDEYWVRGEWYLCGPDIAVETIRRVFAVDR